VGGARLLHGPLFRPKAQEAKVVLISDLDGARLASTLGMMATDDAAGWRGEPPEARRERPSCTSTTTTASA
jgi:hypothetical protein